MRSLMQQRTCFHSKQCWKSIRAQQQPDNFISFDCGFISCAAAIAGFFYREQQGGNVLSKDIVNTSHAITNRQPTTSTDTIHFKRQIGLAEYFGYLHRSTIAKFLLPNSSDCFPGGQWSRFDWFSWGNGFSFYSGKYSG